MKVDKLTVGRVFDPTERLEAPLFQRPYVWEEDSNWIPMWESIQSVAEKLLMSQPARPHFLGAIVLDQLETPTGKVHARQIIDGQQRLTTLQLLLAAARDLCHAEGLEKYAQAFKRLTDNDAPLSEDPDDVFKVWPTNADREEFRDVMSGGSVAIVEQIVDSENVQHLLAKGYVYFCRSIGEWLAAKDRSEVSNRVDLLYRTIRDQLHIVVIDLERDDDAQEIFETLNALGTPLLPADLVKNFLFRVAEQRKEDTSRLYNQYWSTFDNEKSYWREEVRQGRLKRPRVDLFLHHYLTLKTTQEVNATQLFSTFRDYVISNDGQTIAKQMALFRSYSDVYRGFDQFPTESREELFFYRLEQLDTTTIFPLLLEVFKRYSGADHSDELGQIVVDLESYLVRRAICEHTTKNYNRLFVDMIKAVEKDAFTAVAVRDFLLKQTADTGRWPNDEEFGEAWRYLEVYKRLKRGRSRMILEALEAGLHTTKTEVKSIPRKLTVEHLMPREWEKHWPIVVSGDSEGSQEDRAELRKALIETIGNLSLLTKSLNPAVSNSAWAKKRPEILKHSALNLNRSLPENWTEESILARTQSLLSVALKIWPYPAQPA